ncbi:13555_t:CDS:1, partial [Racocetra fulgida]
LTFQIDTKISHKRYAKFPRSAAFVHYKSNHRLKMKKQVVINEVSRLSLLCSKKEDFENEKFELLNFLANSKGYPTHILKSLDYPEWEKRADLLNKIHTNKKEKQMPPIILKVPYDDAIFKKISYSRILQETYEEEMNEQVQRPLLCVTNQPSL